MSGGIVDTPSFSPGKLFENVQQPAMFPAVQVHVLQLQIVLSHHPASLAIHEPFKGHYLQPLHHGGVQRLALATLMSHTAVLKPRVLKSFLGAGPLQGVPVRGDERQQCRLYINCISIMHGYLSTQKPP